MGSQQKKHAEEVKRLEGEKGVLEKKVLETTKTAAEIQEESSAQIAHLQDENQSLHERLREMKDELSNVKEKLATIAKQFIDQASLASTRVEEAEAAAEKA